MPSIIPPGQSLGLLRWSVAGDAEEMICTIGFGAEGLTVQEEADHLYLAATQATSLTPLGAMNQPWTFVGTTVYQRGLGGDPVVAFHNQPLTATAGSATALPSNCALLVKKITATAGRRGRGRFFPPPALIDEGGVDTNGTINSATYTTINNRVISFYGNLGIQGLNPLLFHADGSEATPITSLVLDTRIATQRTRMRR